ncbi:HupE/UreJ family protein [Pelagibius sp. Alg239-R121]|uniref:HupE/UreJ family protein n=1 Tax=Pelagibius sp. Alg239-R121 TaxID=2993448 RepID=UPI0024A744B5|nr:HupE/UreJ family protein [Pelagibius sp. Alg239-R121]
MKRFIKGFALSGALTAASTPALAHHVMDGGLPETFTQGLLSGFGHPVIGVDHLAFIIAVGLASAFTPNRFLTPLAFVVATLLGCAALLTGVTLPIAEIVIAGSIVVLGAMVLSGKSINATVYMGAFAAAGLFHGWAYGQSIIGAETTPLTAYLIGFAVIQYAIAVGAGALARKVWKAENALAIQPRLAGAVVAGVGAAFLIENIEGMLFSV